MLYTHQSHTRPVIVMTEKQIANRKYYAEHAEAIKAKKREQYAAVRKNKPAVRKNKPAVRKNKPKPPEPSMETHYRRKIEDYELARELGVDVRDLDDE